jgi:hypothetical protein
MQCHECNKSYRRNRTPERKEIYRQRKLEKSRRPEEKEKARIKAIAYRPRRRIVTNAAYQKKKDDPEFIKARRDRGNIAYRKMKQELNDGYIKKLLRTYKDASPEQILYKRQEVLEFRKVRADLQEQRKILFEKKTQRKKYIEDNGIIKTCRVHGDLKREDTYFTNNGKNYINKIFICKKCNRESSQKTYESNLDAYRKQNREYARKNKAVIKEKIKRRIENLEDRYVARLLVGNTGIKFEDIDPKLINLKRTLIQIKRKIKEMKS